MTGDEMITGLIPGKSLAYPVPQRQAEHHDLASLRLELERRGFGILDHPPCPKGTHYWLKAFPLPESKA